MWLGVGAEIRLEDRKLHIILADGFKLERLRRGRKEILAAAAEVLGYEPELVLPVNKPLPLFDKLEADAPPQDPAALEPPPVLLPLPLGEGRGEGLATSSN